MTAPARRFLPILPPAVEAAIGGDHQTRLCALALLASCERWTLDLDSPPLDCQCWAHETLRDPMALRRMALVMGLREAFAAQEHKEQP